VPEALWDASALAKRYAPEVGTATVNSLFTHQPRLAMVTTFPGYAETAASLRRRLDRGGRRARHPRLAVAMSLHPPLRHAR
jgi:hypothetical protein